MPIEPRPDDQFTRDNLLLGFPIVEFTPRLADGSLGQTVQLGILSDAALQKEIENLELENGSSGFLTVDREFISKLKPSFQLQTFNLRADVARYIFGSDVLVPIIDNPAAPIVNEPLQVPSGSDADRTFIDIRNGDIDDTAANLTLIAATNTAEEVQNVTGDGTTLGDYALAFKVELAADVTLIQEVDPAGNVVRTFVPQNIPPVSEFQVEVTEGTGVTSGELAFFQAVGASNRIVATYTPGFDLEEDLDAVNPDMVLDPLLGRIRFPNLTGAGFALRPGQPVLLSYLFNQKAGFSMQPFRQNQFEGTASIKQLTDVGVNFSYPIPSATLLLTDDDLTFGADDFATGTLNITINDAGGSNRFGTMTWHSETQANA